MYKLIKNNYYLNGSLLKKTARKIDEKRLLKANITTNKHNKLRFLYDVFETFNKKNNARKIKRYLVYKK